MARTVKDARLSKREHRLKLAVRKEPYWLTIGDGQHLGYYRGARTTKWLARFREPGSQGRSYLQATLGEADDIADANGITILNFGQAQAKAREWLAGVEHEAGRVYGPYTVDQALNDYLGQSQARDLKNTQRRVNAIIRPRLGYVQCAKLTARQIENFRNDIASAPARLRTATGAEQNVRIIDDDDEDARRKRKASANRILSMLKAALNLAFREGRVANDTAWRRVKPFKGVDAPRLRFLSDDEARRLVNAVSANFRPMVMAGLLTGGRYQEIARLRVRDYDAASRTLWIDRTKAGAGRPIYLEAEGVRLIETAIIGKTSTQHIFTREDDKPWGPSHQLRPMREANEAARIEHATFHDIRRTYGARLALKGVPMAVIAKAMGHKDTRITERHYAHLQAGYVSETIREAVAGLGIVDENPAGNIAKIGGQ